MTELNRLIEEKIKEWGIYHVPFESCRHCLMRKNIHEAAEEVRKQFIEKYLPRLNQIRAGIPMTGGETPRREIKELIDELARQLAGLRKEK